MTWLFFCGNFNSNLLVNYDDHNLIFFSFRYRCYIKKTIRDESQSCHWFPLKALKSIKLRNKMFSK